MSDNSLGVAFGLAWNPFSANLPVEGLLASERVDSFAWRLRHHLLPQGGFALVEGEPGSGKSVALRQIALLMGEVDGLAVAALSHPSARLGDFYRQIGESFGVLMAVNNRWRGVKDLRERWLEHVDGIRMRPLLLVDEAQEMPSNVLAELRLLASTEFDSRSVLTVVLAGDNRLKDRMRDPQILPLASRIRHRLVLGPAAPAELERLLDHLLESAGCPGLLSEGVKAAMCRHAGGNRRALAVIGDMLLAAAAERGQGRIDEALFHDVFAGAPKRREARA